MPCPACALTCDENADYGPCVATDDSCLCDYEPFINSTTACIQQTCQGAEFAAAQAAAVSLCEAVVRYPVCPQSGEGPDLLRLLGRHIDLHVCFKHWQHRPQPDRVR